jgi:hypothetical protein
MSERRVKIVLLCEDSQQESFVRHFLEDMGWNTREIRLVKSPKASGSAEQFVRVNFPVELKRYRQRNQRAASSLIAIIDADLKDLQGRMSELKSECDDQHVKFREDSEAIAIAIPKRNIETWIHYLNAGDADEITDYPKLDSPRNCKSAVNRLTDLCRTTGLPQDVPSSLKEACIEYNERIKPALR